MKILNCTERNFTETLTKLQKMLEKLYLKHEEISK